MGRREQEDRQEVRDVAKGRSGSFFAANDPAQSELRDDDDDDDVLSLARAACAL